MKVLFFLRRIGPYHHARFQAACDYFQFIAVETRPKSSEYPWRFHSTGNYKLLQFPVTSNEEKGLRGRDLRIFVSNLIVECDPQVIVTTGWADAEYHAVAAEAIKKNISIVVISDSRYEDEKRRWHKEVVKRLVLKTYEAALVAGRMSRQYLIDLGFQSSSIFQPWDVVDNSYWGKINPVKYSDLTFLCVCRFVPKKNLFLLLRAYHAYLKRGGIRRLTLVGDGEERKAIESFIQENQLVEFVSLEGFKQYEELPFYFQKALCLILPSLSDQWGLVVNEAMAAGVPVLVSKRCGCAVDLVREGRNGYTFDPFNVEQLSEYLTDLDKLGKSDWERMSKCSKQIIENWDVKHFAEGLHDAVSFAFSRKKSFKFRLLHHWLSY